MHKRAPIQFATRAGQTRTSTYDSRNREIVADWSAPGGGQPATPEVTRSYDAAGRLLSLDNGNASLSYAYDAANRLLAETQQPAGQPARVVGYTYDADGNRQSLAYPGGTVVEYAYTARSQVASVRRPTARRPWPPTPTTSPATGSQRRSSSHFGIAHVLRRARTTSRVNPAGAVTESSQP